MENELNETPAPEQDQTPAPEIEKYHPNKKHNHDSH